MSTIVDMRWLDDGCGARPDLRRLQWQYAGRFFPGFPKLPEHYFYGCCHELQPRFHLAACSQNKPDHEQPGKSVAARAKNSGARKPVAAIVADRAMRYNATCKLRAIMKPIGLLLVAVCLLSAVLNATPAARADEVRPKRILIKADPPT